MGDDELTRLKTALDATANRLTRRRTGSPGSSTGEDAASGWAATLERLTAAAVSEVPGAAYAGLTMRGPDGGLGSHAPTGPAIVELDRAQAVLGEGPCVDALGSGRSTMISVVDFALEHDRWPRFTPLALQAGVASLLSFAMAPDEGAPGALNIYATTVAAFDSIARAIAAGFANQAAVALYGAHRVAQLHRALASRDLIGQAKGILMERFTLDDLQAFDLLVRSSQDTNLKLVDVARWLTGDLAQRARSEGSDPHRTGEYAADLDRHAASQRTARR